jgi:hypothetical protein
MRPPLRGVWAPRQAAGQGGLHAAGHQHGQHVAAAGTALQGAEDSRALFGADQAVEILGCGHAFLLWEYGLAGNVVDAMNAMPPAPQMLRLCAGQAQQKPEVARHAAFLCCWRPTPNSY